MPLAFGAILGGTTTLVVTPPNILAAAMLREHGHRPFALFDFTPLGLLLFGLGLLFMITVGRRLIPERQPKVVPRGGDLADLHQLEARLFSLRIPPGSKLDGMTLRQARLGTLLGVQVIGVMREGRKELAPSPDAVLRAGDTLIVEGRFEELRKLLGLQGIEIERWEKEEVPRPSGGVSAARLRIGENSPFAGKTLREVRFRERYGPIVIALVREGEVLRRSLATEILNLGDEMVVVGTRPQISELARTAGFEVAEIGLSAVEHVQENLYLIRVPQDSALVGETLGSSRLGELAGVTVGGVIRSDQTKLAVSPEERIEAGDRLLVSGEAEKIVHLLELGSVELDPDFRESTLESEDVGVVEVTLAPRSRLAGKTLEELRFRERYGLQVLGIWREGAPIRTNLARLRIQMGDALLLQGP